MSEKRHDVDMPTELRDQRSITVGQNIRAEMGRRRVTMVELSKRTKVSRTTLINQLDVTRVTVDNLMKIAEALDVPLSDLLGEEVA